MWKILKNLLILLTVIGVLAAAVVMVVNNSSLTGFEPQAETGTAGFQPPAGFQPGGEPGENPQAFEGERPEREGGNSFAAMELLKNLAIIAAISAVIILLEKCIDWIKRIRKSSAAPS
jgi:hypothetical protein